ncbi:hypothetical protein [cf. Phormidesmis sp. LEGE 11477]|uniref:hypothetical protein n=1 Tax=cf. Phormidesmis sp. LEGE 11477 TaxID=1828680 RepID=UPI00187F732E|nr:hypothetical protein [cf. Phormidesmis sp. LEGE 11477]MBE9060394.1 hypothetical protein [cf. Phormidesmis sp. LEGE 11477]
MSESIRGFGDRALRLAISLSLLIFSLTLIGRSPAYGQSDVGSSGSLPAAIEVSYSN